MPVDVVACGERGKGNYPFGVPLASHCLSIDALLWHNPRHPLAGGSSNIGRTVSVSIPIDTKTVTVASMKPFSRLMNKVRERPKTKKRRKKLRWSGCRVFYGEQIGTIESQELKTEVLGRRGKESNPLVLVLQTNTLPVGYPDVLSQYRKIAIIL